MADLEHGNLTDADGIHEPKGAGLLTGGATDTGKVYQSDGAGSGTWALPTTAGEAAELSLGATTDNATATTLTAQDTWYIIAGTFVEEYAAGLTTTAASGRMNIITDGTYSFEIDMSMIASTGGDTFNFSFMVNGVRAAGTPRIRRKIGTGADVGAASMSHIITGLTAGDYVQVCAAALTAEGGDAPPAGTTITIENAIFRANLLVAA